MIELREIRKRLGKAEVLRGLSLRVEPGELALLLGPNGSGKTTAIRIAAGALVQDAGEALADGRALTPAERRARFGYLPQVVSFQPRLDPETLLRFYARALGAPAAAIAPALRRWGLEAHASKPSSALSGGLRQRLGLAVLSLAPRPALLLDEPGLSLDAEWREAMQAWLKELAREGRAVLVATHLQGEWEGKADRGFLCREGRIEGEADPARLRAESARAPRRIDGEPRAEAGGGLNFDGATVDPAWRTQP